MNRLLLIAAASALTLGSAAAAESTTPAPAKGKTAGDCGMACCELIKSSEGTVTADELVLDKQLVDKLKAALRQIREERREDFKKFWEDMPGDN